tara:strand:- start:126 stop:434 length:309 start_codon:yes stop_codon:yes gene_type:complete
MPKSITTNELRMKFIVNKEPNSQEDESDNFNPKVVTAQEIEEYFDITKSDMMSNIYYRMRERCESSHHGIMRNPKSSDMSDFFYLIKSNVDTRGYYKQKFKL